MTMGQRIRTRRLALKISQAELARAAGIQPQHMWRIETDQAQNPGIEVVRVVAERLGCSLDFLVTGKEPDEGPRAAGGAR